MNYGFLGISLNTIHKVMDFLTNLQLQFIYLIHFYAFGCHFV